MKYILILLFLMLSLSTLHAQDDPVEIYLIESFITPELPNTFVLTFFTSQICKSIVVFKSGQEIEISNEYVEEHKARIDLTPYEIDTTFIKYNIFLETEDGKIIKSETYEVEFPGLIKMKGTWLSYAWTCCIGGIVFGLPAPTYVNIDGEDKFSLAKEIPLFSFFSTGKNYPYGYIGIEYAYIFKMKHNNFMRVGYKQMFQPGTIEYISPGVNLFTNFNGYNGISPEVTIGLFRFYNTFALYTRYRYNFQPVKGGIDFHEISIGLYSNFFSINL